MCEKLQRVLWFSSLSYRAVHCQLGLPCFRMRPRSTMHEPAPFSTTIFQTARQSILQTVEIALHCSGACLSAEMASYRFGIYLNWQKNKLIFLAKLSKRECRTDWPIAFLAVLLNGTQFRWRRLSLTGFCLRCNFRLLISQMPIDAWIRSIHECPTKTWNYECSHTLSSLRIMSIPTQ